MIIKICGSPFSGKKTLAGHLAEIYNTICLDLRQVRADLANERGIITESELRTAQYEYIRKKTAAKPDHFIVVDNYLEYVFNHRIGQPEAQSYGILLSVKDEMTVKKRYQREGREFDRLAYLHTLKLCQDKNDPQDFRLRLLTDSFKPHEVATLAVRGLTEFGFSPEEQDVSNR